MPETLIQFLNESATRFGPRTALLFKPSIRYQRWTYAQLWEQSGQVASLLQKHGLGKGDRALIWGPNCPQWVLAFFGCMRAGVILVPLDLRSAADFAERVASRTQPKLAFVSRVTPNAHGELGLPEIKLEELEELSAGLPSPRDVAVKPDDLAEIMFTSGTTGSPKGVMLTHRNVISDLEAASQYVPGKPSYRLLSVLPLSHTFEQMACLLMALRCGANITYPTSRQPSVLLRTMRERRVTTMLLVPQALELLMKGIEREVGRQGKERLWGAMLRVARYLPLSLRRLLFRRVHTRFGGRLDFIVSGGAALAPELGEKWKLLGVKVIQGYGTTEASPSISCHDLKNPRFDSVGRPLPGVEVRIAEDGEILVRGPNITPGYWEDPEQTARAFEDGWYKTGDLGLIDAKGYLHIKGRKKDMIALADGQKVYPEDVEAVLRRHPAVADVAVVGLPKSRGVQLYAPTLVEVHAVFIMQDKAAAPDVVAWANRQLADHQRVQGFTLWRDEDFPRTHTLKVRKGAILDTLQGVAAPTTTPRSGPKADVADEPRGVRHLVAEVGGVPIAQVTSEKALGAELKLDSLGRVELLSAIEEELGVYLDETEVGPDTTVGQLQAMVEHGSHGEGARTFPRWGMSLWCRIVRGFLQRAFIFPPLGYMYRLRVSGRENLQGLEAPALFAANHTLTLDNGLIIKAMPLRWRRRLAIAASDHLWRNRLRGTGNILLGNGFPFSKAGNVRASLDNLGSILDDGWSVLIYPEGQLTIGGPMKPFLSGTGLVAVEARVPVVPLRLVVNRMGRPLNFPILRRGSVEVRFGKPLVFSPRTSYQDATRAIEDAVRAL